MQFEHFALNVPDPAALAAWYVRHFDMKIVVALKDSPYTHFLADAAGRVCIEVYHNPAGPVPDYAAQHHLQFHWAFADADPAATRDRLLAAGATLVEEIPLDDGGLLIMLRDPWGIAVQLCRRATPMV